MRMLLTALVGTILWCTIAHSQPSLRPTIGVSTPPADTDTICTPGPYPNSFVFAGLDVGSQAFDFTLFDDQGDSVTLGQILSRGKPVLLISASYTCPVFRGNVPAINDIVKKYGAFLSVYIVYTAEAHPIVDKSPYGDGDTYSDEVNANEHIQYRQSKTYAERKAMEELMVSSMSIDAPMLIDAPCNQWLETYGPAPNIGYLIDQAGMVRYKEGWFNSAGFDIFRDIDNLLSVDTVLVHRDTGWVDFTFEDNDTVYASPGSVATITGDLVNKTDADALIRISRRNSSKMPTGWKSALCTDVCLSPDQDSTYVRVPAHGSQHLRVYFYVGDADGTGRVHLRIDNVNIPQDSLRLRVVCIATANAAVSVSSEPNRNLYCIPNPVTDRWTIRTPVRYASIRVYDVLGRLRATYPAADEYSSAALERGVYHLELAGSDGSAVATTLVKR